VALNSSPSLLLIHVNVSPDVLQDCRGDWRNQGSTLYTQTVVAIVALTYEAQLSFGKCFEGYLRRGVSPKIGKTHQRLTALWVCQ